MYKLELVYKGKVQKRMFRDFLRRRAKKMGLSGAVLNFPDGSVYIKAFSHKKEKLDKFARNRNFPFWIKVEDIEYSISALDNFEFVPDSFVIKF